LGEAIRALRHALIDRPQGRERLTAGIQRLHGLIETAKPERKAVLQEVRDQLQRILDDDY
jgi:hypothetical protein